LDDNEFIVPVIVNTKITNFLKGFFFSVLKWRTYSSDLH